MTLGLGCSHLGQDNPRLFQNWNSQIIAWKVNPILFVFQKFDKWLLQKEQNKMNPCLK